MQLQSHDDSANTTPIPVIYPFGFSYSMFMTAAAILVVFNTVTEQGQQASPKTNQPEVTNRTNPEEPNQTIFHILGKTANFPYVKNRSLFRFIES